MTFLDKLNMLMEHRGYKKSDLAKISNIPYTTIDGWYKKGYDGLRLSTLRKLSDCFGVSLSFWIDGDDDDDIIKKEPPASAEGDEVSYDEFLHLLQSLGFVKDGFDLTEEDVSFLSHVFGLLDAWFSGKGK